MTGHPPQTFMREMPTNSAAASSSNRPHQPDTSVEFPFLQYRADRPSRPFGAVTTTLWLRIASVISLSLHRRPHDGRPAEVVAHGRQPRAESDDRRAFRRPWARTGRISTSSWDSDGRISVLMLMQTILLWQLASLARTDPTRLRPMIAVIALATVASGVIAWRFIFPVPAVFSGVLAIALGVAYVTAR